MLGHDTAMARDALREQCDKVRSSNPSGRNNVLNKAAFNMGVFVKVGHIDRHEVLAELYSAARQRGLMEGVCATIRSGLDAGIASAPF